MHVLFNVTATTEIYTLSLHDALPICAALSPASGRVNDFWASGGEDPWVFHAESSGCRTSASPRCSTRCLRRADRKSTRLNSSHRCISYAVFCLKKKNQVTGLDGGSIH